MIDRREEIIDAEIAKGTKLDPTRGDDILAALQRAGYSVVMYAGQHLIEVTDDDWSIQHPLACRPDLLACAHHRCIVQHDNEYGTVMVDAPGVYSFVIDEDGGPTFTRHYGPS